MASYSFVTTWRIPAAPERVWEAMQIPGMPWWPNMIRSHPLTPDPTGVGSRTERVTRGLLPYSLRYVLTVTEYVPPHRMAYTSEGDLVGKGSYSIEASDQGSTVLFHWNVSTTGRWLNLLAPLLKPLFAWNHNHVMTQGEAALTRHLEAHSSNTESLKQH